MRKLGEVEAESGDEGGDDTVVEPEQAESNVGPQVATRLILLLGFGSRFDLLTLLAALLRLAGCGRSGSGDGRLLHERDNDLRVGKDGAEVLPHPGSK